ncbi:MAG: glycosyltransferase [Elainellaceae cyanobacterium]
MSKPAIANMNSPISHPAMRPLYFLVPGTSSKFGSGGLWAELSQVKLAQQICEAQVVTYEQREPDTLFLDDLLQSTDGDRQIFVMSWGFHVPKLVKKLRGFHAVYRAHSAGYRFTLPPDIPILAVSRNTLGYWGQRSSNSLLYYLPNAIGEEFHNQNLARDIDVLVQTRKSSGYLLHQLVPQLQSRCTVKVLDRYVDDLAGLFNRTQVYLYDSAEYWGQYGVSEGFGLPPMEAMACGCQVFSSVNGALADYLDPGVNCHKIAAHSTEFDMQRILAQVNAPHEASVPDSFFDPYRATALISRMRIILTEINTFFDHKRSHAANISALTPSRRTQLLLKRIRKKLQR